MKEKSGVMVFNKGNIMKKRKKETVELIPAAMWICNECREDNFLRLINEEIDPEEEQAILEDLDDPEAVSAASYLYPIDVKCKNCNEEFEIEKYQCDECKENNEQNKEI